MRQKKGLILYVRVVMPLILSEKNPKYGRCYLWSLTEDSAFFKEYLVDQSTQIDHIKEWHPKRQKEWLSGRYLLSRFTGCKVSDLGVSAHGKPYFKNSALHFSISHTQGLVGFLIHDQSVGLDIQIKTDKIQRVAHKFCSQQDYTVLGLHYGRQDVELVTWSIKEAVFKAYGHGGISYQDDILIEKAARINTVMKVQVRLKRDDDVNITYEGKVRMIGSYCISQVRPSMNA